MNGYWIQPSADPPDESDDEECFAYDLFLACVTGLIARGFDAGDIYEHSKSWAQHIYDAASKDKKFHEVMDQTWPTKFS